MRHPDHEDIGTTRRVTTRYHNHVFDAKIAKFTAGGTFVQLEGEGAELNKNGGWYGVHNVTIHEE